MGMVITKRKYLKIVDEFDTLEYHGGDQHDEN